MAGRVSEAVIKRLPGYYRHLRELEAEGVVQISSQELGERMNLTPSQIRQDINCFGGFGRQGYGYNVTSLKGHIAEILGLTNPHTMIIIGAGNIGSAVSRYKTFTREGFTTIAAFDSDPAKIGKTMGSVKIYDIAELTRFLESNHVDIAVLAVPVNVAQETADMLVACGIRAIWNFSPTDLRLPGSATVVNIHMSDSLEILSYKMAHNAEEV